MSTVDLHRPLAERFSLDRGHGTMAPRPVVHSQSPAATWWIMLLASSVALITSGYLAWSAFTSSPVAGCGSGGAFDCGHVLRSQWSTVLTIPVSVLAMATHVGVLTMLFWKPVSERLNSVRWSVLGFASLAAGGAAIWFIGLQMFWIQHFCPYCLVAHTAGIILAAAFWFARPISGVPTRWLVAAASVSLASLIGLQTFNEIPPTFEIIEYGNARETEKSTPASPSTNAGESEMLFEAPARRVSNSNHQAMTVQLLAAILDPATLFYGQVGVAEGEKRTAQVLGGIKLETNAWPLLGKPDAELVFVELFDYTCSHCQQTHKSLEAAREHFGDKLAIITLPVPLNAKCNPTVKSTHASHSESCELAKLAVAVWAVDHSKFASFHHDLFESQPNYAQALSKARSLVNEDELAKTLQSSLPSDYVAKHVALYQRAGSGAIPKLLFPQTSTVGAIESPDTLIRLIEQHL